MRINEGQLSHIHAEIKQQYKHDEPRSIVNVSNKGVIVTAFDRSRGDKKKFYHVVKKVKDGWKHDSRHTDLNNASYVLGEAFMPRKQYGPSARRPVVLAMKLIRRSRGVQAPNTSNKQNRRNTRNQANWRQQQAVRNMLRHEAVDMDKLAALNKALAARGFAPRTINQQHMINTQGHLYKKTEMPKVTSSGVETVKPTPKVVTKPTVTSKGSAKKSRSLTKLALHHFMKGIMKA